MDWFGSDVVAAAEDCKNRKLVALVYVSDSASSSLDDLFTNTDVVSVCKSNCVSVKISSQSELGKQFSQIYNISGVPSVFLIGKTGRPLDIVSKPLKPAEFIKRMKAAVDKNGSKYRETVDIKKRQSVDKAEKTESASESASETPKPLPSKPVIPDICRIQFRLPDGSSTSDSFPSGASLGDAWSTTSQKLAYQKGRYSLVTIHPRRQFEESDMDKSLIDLELVPSAVIVVVPAHTNTSQVQSAGLFDKMFSMVIGMLVGIWNSILALFGGGGGGGSAPSSEPRERSADVQGEQERWQAKRRRQPEHSEIKKRREGNITRLSALRDDDSDDEATWNGNSTQQM